MKLGHFALVPSLKAGFQGCNKGSVNREIIIITICSPKILGIVNITHNPGEVSARVPLPFSFTSVHWSIDEARFPTLHWGSLIRMTCTDENQELPLAMDDRRCWALARDHIFSSCLSQSIQDAIVVCSIFLTVFSWGP